MSIPKQIFRRVLPWDIKPGETIQIHKLGCEDESTQHMHVTPKCCDDRCWCLSLLQKAQKSEEQREHKLGCDEMHGHAPPNCCRPSCWCRLPKTRRREAIEHTRAKL